ncbi:PHP domain-containing protein [Patescibacteria group bacterium]|nr:PHP domain-containing protein [Patescibacteria group bacterium]
MKKADLHLHTNISDGTRSPESVVDYIEYAKSFNKIYITDHNKIEGSIIAKSYALSRGYKLEVGIGSEVSTSKCHMLALDIKKNIKKGLTPEHTAEEILSQGGFPIIAHPFNPFNFSRRHSGGRKVIEGLLLKDIPFAIEYNGSMDYATLIYQEGTVLKKSSSISSANKKALDIASEYSIPIVASSDAHMGRVIGSAYTLYEDDLIEDIKSNKIKINYNFTKRNIGIPYFSYHLLLDPLPIPRKYKRNLVRYVMDHKSETN